MTISPEKPPVMRKGSEINYIIWCELRHLLLYKNGIVKFGIEEIIEKYREIMKVISITIISYFFFNLISLQTMVNSRH